MKKVKILSVCGSGVVSSSMVAIKLKDILSEYGFAVQTVEACLGNIETTIAGSHFDLIACVSPVYQDYGIPKVNAIGMLIGFGEKEVIESCLKILNNINK
jgi:PTS system galactitol-specific IIB component